MVAEIGCWLSLTGSHRPQPDDGGTQTGSVVNTNPLWFVLVSFYETRTGSVVDVDRSRRHRRPRYRGDYIFIIRRGDSSPRYRGRNRAAIARLFMGVGFPRGIGARFVSWRDEIAALCRFHQAFPVAPTHSRHPSRHRRFHAVQPVPAPVGAFEGHFSLGESIVRCRPFF